MADQGGTGEPVGHPDLPEVGRKPFLGREMKHILDPIEESDEEYTKEHEIGDETSALSKSINAATGDLNESNYQLRRTAKLMDLHHEFNKEDLRVVLGPKRVDSSSSDSCDEDIIFPNMISSSDMKKCTRNVVISDDSLIHATGK